MGDTIPSFLQLLMSAPSSLLGRVAANTLGACLPRKIARRMNDASSRGSASLLSDPKRATGLRLRNKRNPGVGSLPSPAAGNVDQNDFVPWVLQLLAGPLRPRTFLRPGRHTVSLCLHGTLASRYTFYLLTSLRLVALGTAVLASMVEGDVWAPHLGFSHPGYGLVSSPRLPAQLTLLK